MGYPLADEVGSRRLGAGSPVENGRAPPGAPGQPCRSLPPKKDVKARPRTHRCKYIPRRAAEAWQPRGRAGAASSPIGA